MATRGYEGVTAKQLAGMGAAPKAKYGSVKTVVDGITFDSKKEAKRYHELKLQQQAGHIKGLRWQPRYTLFALVLERADLHDANAGTVSERRQPVCDYVADFEYVAIEVVPRIGVCTTTPSRDVKCHLVVEDVKSPATRKKEVYRLKRKLFEAQYGITIREV